MPLPTCDDASVPRDTIVIVSSVSYLHETPDEYRWARNPSRASAAATDFPFGIRMAPRLSLRHDSTSSAAHAFTTPVRHEPSAVLAATPNVVRQLRDRAGLTWDQLARAFGVDKRSLHNWAGGAPMNAANRERLQRLLALIAFIDRGFVDQTRAALLTPTPDGQLVLDWLAAGRDADVRDLLGHGPTHAQPPRPETSISLAERARRRPPPPAVLLDARDDADVVARPRPTRVIRKLRGVS